MDRFEVKTSFGSLCVYKRGEGERKIVLLHGSGCDNAMLSWREVMECFSDEYTVYAPDLLGYGRSAKPENMAGKHFYDIHSSAVKEMADKLGLDCFALAGLSMGGAIAMSFALKYPQRVTALFPVDPWGISEKVPLGKLSEWYIHKTDFTLKQFGLIAKYRFLAKWFAGYSLIGDRKKITQELIGEIIEACLSDGAGKAMLDYQRSSVFDGKTFPYYVNELSQLKMPVMFITGDKDPLVPVTDVQYAAEKAGAQICILKGCRHWSVKECPERFCEAVDRVLSEL